MVSGIAILNLSWLLFSLPIFTVIPATDAVLKLYMNGRKMESLKVFLLNLLLF